MECLLSGTFKLPQNVEISAAKCRVASFLRDSIGIRASAQHGKVPDAFRVGTAVQHVWIYKNPRIAQAFAIRYKFTKIFFMVADAEFDSHEIGNQSAALTGIISSKFTKLSKGNGDNVLPVFFHRIPTQNVVLYVDISQHFENVPQVLVLASIGGAVQCTHGIIVNLHPSAVSVY